MTTVAELIADLTELDPKNRAPIEFYIDDLSYIVDALEQWRNMMEISGRTLHPEVDQFLARAYEAL